MISHKFRLYPNKEQEKNLAFALDICRQAYNMMLGELNEQAVIDKKMIQAMLPEMKICEPKFREVYSKTLQYECYKLFSNLRALSSVKKKGRKVGRLRFKGRDWFKTITYNQSGFKIIENNKRFSILQLSKIGEIKVRQHREIEGEIKQVTIKKMPTNKWFVIIQAEGKRVIKRGKKKIGIDLGINNFIADSEGNFVAHPHNFDKYANQLKQTQRDLF